jgi:hypothetical protein
VFAQFRVVELEYIRRQQVNRAQQQTRHRVWVHAVFESVKW